MRLFRIFVAASLPVMIGCHSAHINATVSNRTSATIPLIEVDYPSASFGTENLAPGGDYHYQFKIIGNGRVKIIYTDASRKEQSFSGPVLHEGDDGPLSIVITPEGVRWTAPPAKH